MCSLYDFVDVDVPCLYIVLFMIDYILTTVRIEETTKMGRGRQQRVVNYR